MPNQARVALVMSVLVVATGCERLERGDPTYCGLGFYVTGDDIVVLADDRRTDFDVARIAYRDVVWVVYSGNGVRPPRYSNAGPSPGEWAPNPETAGLFSTTGFAFPMYVEIQPSGASAASVAPADDLRALSKALRPRSIRYDPCIVPKIERYSEMLVNRRE